MEIWDWWREGRLGAAEGGQLGVVGQEARGMEGLRLEIEGRDPMGGSGG